MVTEHMRGRGELQIQASLTQSPIPSVSITLESRSQEQQKGTKRLKFQRWKKKRQRAVFGDKPLGLGPKEMKGTALC